jgi:hypothetical protein
MSGATDIKEKIAALLNAWPYFVDIPVLIEEAGDLAQAIKLSLGALQKPQGAKKTGLCAIVMSPDPELTNPGVPMLDVHYAYPVILVENPSINQGSVGTKKAALDATIEAMKALHWKASGQPGRLSRLELDKVPYERIEFTEKSLERLGFKVVIAYQVNVTAGAVEQ